VRVLAWACLALAGCFGPTVGDGSFLCEDGLECPEGMFCRTDCSPRRCYFDPTAACPADAGPVVDSPLPVLDAPTVAVDARSPIKDAPSVTIDAPSSSPDAVVIITLDGPVIRVIDARIVISTDAL
jgi:hypothetical protein